MKIWAHTLVKNEERYVWFAVNSMINYVDKILLWDTGSNDNTWEILKNIKKIYPKKVELKEVGEVSTDNYTNIRQQMLSITKSDWVIILDGDEVWWDSTAKKLVDTINSNKNVDSIVTHYVNLVGDIYHYQEERAGLYEIDGKKGHLTIRAMNMKIEGLHLEKPHGTQGFFDEDGVLVQLRDKKNRLHIDEPGYLHFTNLPRSSNRKSDLVVPKRGAKLKYEIGSSFPLDFYYPEVFFRPRPRIITSPWVKMDEKFRKKSLLQTPLRKIKRRLMPAKVGY